MQTERPNTGSRVEPRAPSELKVVYKQLNRFFADYTRNISKGGTFIKTTKPLPVGTEFIFKLSIPKLPDPLELKGRVQWVVEAEQATAEKEAGMGVGFVYDTESDRTRVEALVDELMRQSLGPVLHQKLIATRNPKE